MKEYVVCKSCGYVMEKGKLHDVCPACGVPAKMFEPYAERLSPRRRLILSLDLHPITVHFTQAFAITLPLLCLAALLVTGLLRATIAATKLDKGAKKKDQAFYEGQLKSAEYFTANFLPVTLGKIDALMATNSAAVDISEDSFGGK